jgi:TRAP-type C4-dicarboxylate transport system permease small subunit
MLDKFSKAVSNILAGIAAIALIVWGFVIVVFVTARSVFNVNWMFVEEYSGYCMVLLVSFSLAFALRRGGHIRVAVVTKLASDRVQKFLKTFADIIGLIVTVYLTKHGVQWFLHGLEGGARSWFPSRTLMWPVYALIPIGLAALSLEFVQQLVADIREMRQGVADQNQGGR